MEKKDRIYELDLIRALACLMIISMHSPLPEEGENYGLFLSSISYLSAPGIGLFFMVSGALLLPIMEPTSVFIKKRLIKIVIPTLIWTCFYLLIKLFYDGYQISLRDILSIPFSPQGNSIFWFIYVLIGIYLIAPILSKWLEKASKREIEFYLLLWVITLCYPYLKLYLSINETETGALYYYSGYLGYFLLGYYLRKYALQINSLLMCALFALALVVPVVLKTAQMKVDFYSMFWYLSLFVAIMSAGWFVLFMRKGNTSNIRMRALVTNFSKCSFGIYLVHIFIMRRILWHCTMVQSIESYILQTIVIIVLTALFSWLVCYLICLLPIGQYLIGYSSKKNNKSYRSC